jgi:hypothetical protein
MISNIEAVGRFLAQANDGGMSRVEALEAVAEAARVMWSEVYGKPPVERSNILQRAARVAFEDAYRVLHHLPAAPEPARGEVVEVAMWEAEDGYIELSKPGSPSSKRSGKWVYHGTTRLPLVKGDGA